MTTPATANPLLEFLASRGAILDESRVSALHFGNPEQEFAAFSGSSALVPLSSSSSFIHEGADALDLLHRLSTNDLLQLVPGRSAFTILTSERGRIIDVLNVGVIENGRLLLLSESPDAQATVDWIEKFTIIEDSSIRDAAPDFTRFAVVGPSALDITGSAFGVELNFGELLLTPATTDPLLLVVSGWAGVGRVDVVAPLDQADAAWERLSRAGAVPAGAISFRAAHIANGVPAPGNELNSQANPLEVRLHDLVSFTKGCYIGQEVVARLDTYDKLQKRLVALEYDSGLKAGSYLTSAGRRAGQVTSVSPITGPGAGSAVGLVRRGYWKDGTQLDSEGITVTVRELPDMAPFA